MTSENFDFGRGHVQNSDHLTSIILEFWPWSWSKIIDRMTMTCGRMVKLSWSPYSPSIF